MRKRNIALILGTLILLIILLIMLFPQMIASQSPYSIQHLRFLHTNDQLDIERAPFAPDQTFLLGSDHLGRDIYSYIIYGTRLTIALGILVALGQFVIAVPMAIVAGFGNRIAKSIIQQFNVTFSAIPALLIAIILLKLDYFTGLDKEKSILAFVIILSVVSWGKLSILVMERVEAILMQPFIKGEIAIGKKRLRIALENVIPHLAPELIVLFFMEVARSLSMLMQLGVFAVFVGNLGLINDPSAGVPINVDISFEPEWASMLSTSRTLISTAPWAVLYPAFAFFISVLGFNLFGEGLRTVLQRKESRSVLMFRKFVTLDFKYLWFNTNKSSKLRVALWIGLFAVFIGSFSMINQDSYGLNYKEDAYAFPERVVIGTEEAKETAQLIAEKMSEIGVVPLDNVDEGYILAYDIGPSYLIESQSLEIQLEDTRLKYDPGTEFSIVTSGNINASGMIYDATKDDLYSLNTFEHLKNQFVLIDQTYYNDAAIEYFIDQISKGTTVKGFLLVARPGESIQNNIVKASESMVVIKMSRLASEKIRGALQAELFIEATVKKLEATGNNVVGIRKGTDANIGDEALVIGLSYNYMEAHQSAVLEFNLKLMERLCQMSGNRRSLIFLFLDGTINEKEHGIHSLADNFPYSSQKVQVYLDLTKITSEYFGQVVFSAAQAPVTRQFAWGLGHQLDAMLTKMDYPQNRLQARYIDGSYYFTENDSDNALFWNRGMPTVILGTQLSESNRFSLKSLGPIILEVVNQNNY